MPSKAPVEHVGGTRDSGPWPADVEEIAEGKAYNRKVVAADGSVIEASATVTSVQEILASDGTSTGGYVVSFQFDDPTAGGSA